MTFWRTLLVAVALGTGGCVGDAPRELDALLHYFWDEFESAPAVLQPAVTNLHAALAGDDLGSRKDGTIKDLDQAAVAKLAIAKQPKTSDASGFFVGRKFECAFPQLEKISYWLDQKDLYGSSAYESYWRAYTSSLDDYLARTSDTLTWDSQYTTKIGVATFTAKNQNTMRYVDGPPGLGPVLLRRSWLPEPADAPSGSSFKQDYQLEVYYRRSDGNIVHAYAIWRDMNVGGIGDEQDFFAGIMIQQMAEWDDKTQGLCKDNRP